MRAGGSAPGWSRFRHVRQAGWRTTARNIRRGAAPEHREGFAQREARLQAIGSFVAREVGALGDGAGSFAPARRQANAPPCCLESARLVSDARAVRSMPSDKPGGRELVA